MVQWWQSRCCFSIYRSKRFCKKYIPTITRTSPANNATYLAGGNVYLNAIASDADGTISNVEFYSDATLLFTAIDTPYTFKWEYSLKVGMVTTSDTIHISVVPNKPPRVSIINPANSKIILKGATVHLQAAASSHNNEKNIFIGKKRRYLTTNILVDPEYLRKSVNVFLQY